MTVFENGPNPNFPRLREGVMAHDANGIKFYFSSPNSANQAGRELKDAWGAEIVHCIQKNPVFTVLEILPEEKNMANFNVNVLPGLTIESPNNPIREASDEKKALDVLRNKREEKSMSV